MEAEIKRTPDESTWSRAKRNVDNLRNRLSRFQDFLSFLSLIDRAQFSEYYNRIKHAFEQQKYVYLVEDDGMTEIFQMATGRRKDAYKGSEKAWLLTGLDIAKKAAPSSGESINDISFGFVEDSIKYYDDFYNFQFE